MTLATSIQVNTQYTRSINIERDASTTALINSYIPTSRVIATIDRLTPGLSSVDCPRAWSLVGPYGCGKSAFAIFLRNLLGNPAAALTKTAHDRLKAFGADQSTQLKKALRGSAGLCPVLLTGGPEPLGRRLLAALADAAEDYWAARPGRNPAIVARLRKAEKSGSADSSDVLRHVRELRNAVVTAKGKGLLIVIDELGKFLEYEARHYGANDIYLLQSLAEEAYRGGTGNIFLFALLHQSFEQYARGLSETLKNEWSKIQGRFEVIPFLEGTEQTLRVVSEAIVQNFSADEQQAVARFSETAAQRLETLQMLPGALTVEGAATLLEKTYPLHPVTVLMLPALCHKVAQNERTLFSYLGSKEPHGFLSSISFLGAEPETVEPHELYDYFIHNQPGVVSDPLTHRRWAEVVTAVERLGDQDADLIALAKTIGLLNLTGAHSGLKATPELLALVTGSEEKAKALLEQLVSKSVVQYRKFSNEYRVWQGTDFDIEATLDEELSKLGRFDLAQTMNERVELPIIVARRHAIQSGTVRFFEARFVDATNISKPLERAVPEIAFYLCEGQDDEQAFLGRIDQSPEARVSVLCGNGLELRAAVSEVIALERIQSSYQELNSDPIASRELHDRLDNARRIQSRLLNRYINDPVEQRWFWRGQQLQVQHRRDLQVQLSAVLDHIFDKAPIISNELINRTRPSSQAHAARNKVVQGMLERADLPRLGIDKYPAERSIYESLLFAGKLHRRVGGRWRLMPPTEDDPLRLQPVWAAIEQFFEHKQDAPTTVEMLKEQLASSPFGLKEGVFPLLFLTYYLVNSAEVAVFEDGQYLPELKPEHAERFCRAPHTFAFQLYRIAGSKALLLDEYFGALYPKQSPERNVLRVIKPFAKVYQNLPLFAQRTKHVSEDALSIRKAFQLSKSPEKFVFEELPKALGYPSSLSGVRAASDYDGLGKRLVAAVQELKKAHDRLRQEMQSHLARSFGLDPAMSLAELRRVLLGYCHGLEGYSVDVTGVKAFLARITHSEGSDDVWLGSILLFLGRRPTEKWTDDDQDAARLRLAEFGRSVVDLEKLRVHQRDRHRQSTDAFEVVLLKSIRSGASEREGVIAITERIRAESSSLVADLQKLLMRSENEAVRLAALATLVESNLSEKPSTQHVEEDRSTPRTASRKLQ